MKEKSLSGIVCAAVGGGMEVSMSKILISLDTFEKIKKFIKITCQLDYDLDLVSGRYVVDGKSLMGIFSLDLTKPIEVHLLNNKVIYPEELKEFIVGVA